MAANNPKDEVDLILNAINNEWGSQIVQGDRLYPGLYIDGIESIQWMKDNNKPRWRENEWQHYFIKYILQDILKNHFEIKSERKFEYLEGRYPWDIRVRATYKTTKVSLTDKAFLDNFFSEHNGYGLIVINVIPDYDRSGDFLKWHEKLKGGLSDYTQGKRDEGTRPRIRKSGVFILDSVTYYFPSLENFQEGYNQGWLSEWGSTTRNSNDVLRNPKYMFDLRDYQNENSNPYRISYMKHNIEDEDEDEDEDDNGMF